MPGYVRVRADARLGTGFVLPPMTQHAAESRPWKQRAFEMGCGTRQDRLLEVLSPTVFTKNAERFLHHAFPCFDSVESPDLTGTSHGALPSGTRPTEAAGADPEQSRRLLEPGASRPQPAANECVVCMNAAASHAMVDPNPPLPSARCGDLIWNVFQFKTFWQ